MHRQRTPIMAYGTRTRAAGKGAEAEQLRRQARRALQLADSVPYQQLSRSLLARAAELLVKAQQLEQPEPLLPASKDGRGG
jgi:phage shock protein A